MYRVDDFPLPVGSFLLPVLKPWLDTPSMFEIDLLRTPYDFKKIWADQLFRPKRFHNVIIVCLIHSANLAATSANYIRSRDFPLLVHLTDNSGMFTKTGIVYKFKYK